ncbi:nesprin-2a isoform X4 [Denticeps clupeoides]|uniref:nesprin-2a isoform X4 n=1 Tax=Denticeps clupeoides TaxID=299321 RepID=UPI0010A2ED8E|nr:nesprin-2-like isoform X4 [Denticeps clupeoides]
MASGSRTKDSPMEEGGVPLDIDGVRMVLQVEQEQIQKRTFTNWVNAQLSKRTPPSLVLDLFADLRDGSCLLDLLEVMSGQRLKRERGSGIFQQRGNIEKALNFLRKKSIKLVNINISDIIEGRPAIILGLVWTIILHCHIEELASTLSFGSRHSSLDSLSSLDSNSSSSSPVPACPSPQRGSPLHTRLRLTAKKALLLWAREQCHKVGCSITVKDFKSSWRSGVAFLAILSSLRPDLVDLSVAEGRTSRQNLEEAFALAEQELRIPRLLEPEDIDIDDPDERSIMTYVSQFLQYSNNLPSANDDFQRYTVLSPVSLHSCYAPGITASPLHQTQASPSQKAHEMTTWLQRAYQELQEVWTSTEEAGYAARYQAIQTFTTSFYEQRRPVIPMLSAMTRSARASKEQHALRQAWNSLAEKLQQYNSQLDMSLPAPLDSLGQWLQQVEVVLAEEGEVAQDHARAAREARDKQEQLKVLMEDMGEHLNTLHSFSNSSESDANWVPPDKLDELEKRVANARVTAKYHGIKLEYKEHWHSFYSLLGQLNTKLGTWKGPYTDQESVRALLQDWHETVDQQRLVSTLRATFQMLKKAAGAYTSKTALSEDAPLVNRQVKEAEGEVTASTEVSEAVGGTMERVLDAWGSYRDCLCALQVWMEQETQGVASKEKEGTLTGLAERSAQQAKLNELGNFLIEVTDSSTSYTLADELSKINVQWAEFIKRIKFAVPPRAKKPPSVQAAQAVVEESGWLLREAVDVTSVVLRNYRRKLQIMISKISEVDVDSLAPSSHCPADSLQKLKHTLPEMRESLGRAEHTCEGLQCASSLLEGRLAELDHWGTEASEAIEVLKEQQHRGYQGSHRRAKSLISRGLQLEGQLTVEQQELQTLVTGVQKTSALPHLSVLSMQDRVKQAVSQTQGMVEMLSCFARKREGGPSGGQPSPKVIVRASIQPGPQRATFAEFSPKVQSTSQSQSSPQTPSCPQETSQAHQPAPPSAPLDTSGEFQLLPCSVDSSRSHLQTQPEAQTKIHMKHNIQEASHAPQRSEVYLRAQALARSRLSKAKCRIESHIQEVNAIFSDRTLSEQQARRKEGAVKLLQPDILEEFLGAVEGVGPFCTEAQLRDAELLTLTVRRQWEAVCLAIAAFMPLFWREVERRQSGSQPALRHALHTNAPSVISEEACLHSEESEGHLETLRRTLRPSKPLILAKTLQTLEVCSGTGGESKLDGRGWMTGDGTLLTEAVQPADPPQRMVHSHGASVEDKETPLQLETVSRWEEGSSHQEAHVRYAASYSSFQLQLQKNLQWLQAGFPPGSGTLQALNTHLHELQTLRQETAALWFEFELQFSQCSPHMADGSGTKPDRTELTQQWRGQQICLQTRMKVLETVVKLMEPADVRIALISDKLDQITRKPVDIIEFTLADSGSLHETLKHLKENIHNELDHLVLPDSEENSHTSVRDPGLQQVNFGAQQALQGFRQQMEELGECLKRTDSALGMLEKFLLKLQEANGEITQALSSQTGRSPLGPIRHRLQEAAAEVPQLAVLLGEAGISLTLEGSPASVQDVVSALVRRLDDADARLTQGLNEGEKDCGQGRDQEERGERLVGRGRRALQAALRELKGVAERQVLKEATLPALQQRLRILTETETKLTSLSTELQSVREASAQATGPAGDLRQLEVMWEETNLVVRERREQCQSLIELLKAFQSCRSRLGSFLHRAEQSVSEQASYMGKENLQRLIGRVTEIKFELSSLGDGVEEIRVICRQLQSQMKKVPEGPDTPFENEADALMDRWLDVVERTDSHLENLQLGLSLWDKLLLLGEEVEAWANEKLGILSQTRPLQSEQEVTSMQEEIQTQQENIEHFHHRASEIQTLLQSKEHPLELQVIESQLRKKMELVMELFCDTSDVFRELMAAKGLVGKKLAECWSSLQRIQDSVNTLSHAEDQKIQESSKELEVQAEQAVSVLQEVALMVRLAGPEMLQDLVADAAHLQESLSASRVMLTQKMEEVETLRRCLQGMSERASSCQYQRQQACCGLEVLQTQMESLPQIFPWPGVAERRQTAKRAQGLLERAQALGQVLSALSAQRKELAQQTRDPCWTESSWDTLENHQPILVKKFNEMRMSLQDGAQTEERCVQLLQQCTEDLNSLQTESTNKSEALTNLGKVDNNIQKVDALAASLLDSLSPEGQVELAKELQILQDKRTLLEGPAQDVSENQEDKQDMGDTGIREQISSLQEEAENLNEALEEELIFGVQQDDISQLRQHWSNLKDLESSKQDLNLHLINLQDSVRSAAIQSDFPTELASALTSLTKQADSLSVALAESQRLCRERTALGVREAIQAVRMWNQSQSEPCQNRSVSTQMEVKRGEELWKALQEVLLQRKFLTDSVGPEILESLERDGSDALSNCDTCLSALSQLTISPGNANHHENGTTDASVLRHSEPSQCSDEKTIKQEAEEARFPRLSVKDVMSSQHTVQTSEDHAHPTEREFAQHDLAGSQTSQKEGFRDTGSSVKLIDHSEQAELTCTSETSAGGDEHGSRLFQSSVPAHSAQATARGEEPGNCTLNRTELLGPVNLDNQSKKIRATSSESKTTDATQSQSPKTGIPATDLRMTSGAQPVELDTSHTGFHHQQQDPQGKCPSRSTRLPSHIQEETDVPESVWDPKQQEHGRDKKAVLCQDRAPSGKGSATEQDGTLPLGVAKGTTVLEMLADVQPLLDASVTLEMPSMEDSDFLQPIPTEAEACLNHTVHRVLACRYQPTQLNPEAMAQQLHEAESCRQFVLEMVAGGGQDMQPGTSHSMEGRLQAALLNASATVQIKEAQVLQVTQYNQQTAALRATLQRFTAEMETLNISCLESSAIQAEHLQSFLKRMDEEKSKFGHLLETCCQVSVHLGEADGPAALLAHVKGLQEGWLVLEGTASRTLRHATFCAMEASAYCQDVEKLENKLEHALEDSKSFSTPVDSTETIHKTVMRVEWAASIEHYLHMIGGFEAFNQNILGKKELEDMSKSLQSLQAKLAETETHLSDWQTTSSDPSEAKLVDVIQDFLAWAKQVECKFLGRRKVALFPDRVHHQIMDMKKLQSRISNRHSEMLSVMEELNVKVPSPAPFVMSLLQNAYKNILERIDHALKDMNLAFQSREKLWSQINDVNTWVGEYLDKESNKASDTVFKGNISDLQLRLQWHASTLKEAERQAVVLETLLEQIKDVTCELSVDESHYLVDKLSTVQAEVAGIMNHEQGAYWELEELLHAKQATDEELATVQKSLSQISVDLERLKFPDVSTCLGDIESKNHMVMEHQCHVQELQYCQESERKALLQTINNLLTKTKTLRLHAREHQKYLMCRKRMECFKEALKSRVTQIPAARKDLGELYRTCQAVLVYVPLAKLACQESADQLEAISGDLYPSQLTSERRKVHQTVESLATWELTIQNEIKSIEIKLPESLSFPTDLIAINNLFHKADQELSQANCFHPREHAIERELLICLTYQNLVESALRILELLKCRNEGELEGYPELSHQGKRILNNSNIRKAHLTRAWQALKDYQWAVRGAVQFLQGVEPRFLLPLTGNRDCVEEQVKVQKALATMRHGFQNHMDQVSNLVPRNSCFSVTLTEQLQIRVLSCLLVKGASLDAQAQLALDVLARQSEKQNIHMQHHKELGDLLQNLEFRLSEFLACEVTSLEDCSGQHDKAKALHEEVWCLAGRLEELRGSCPRLGCGLPVKQAVAALWGRWARLKHRVRVFMARSLLAQQEWTDVVSSMKRRKLALEGATGELPDLHSSVRGARAELESLLALTEMQQDCLDKEQQALVVSQALITRLVGSSAQRDTDTISPICQELQSLQNHCRSLREQCVLVRRAVLSEIQERGRVLEEIGAVRQRVTLLRPLLDAHSDAPRLQELKIELGSEKAKLQGIIDRMNARPTHKPQEIQIPLEEVSHALKEVEEALAAALEQSSPFHRLGDQVKEVTGGLEEVQALLQQSSPSVTEAERKLKRVWDELDQWHSRMAVLEAEVQEVAIEEPEKAHKLMDKLTDPLQLYQTVAKQAEQRTTFLGRIPVCLQELEETLNSASHWLKQARAWLNMPCTYITAKCLHGHTNSLQMVLDDSDGIKTALEAFAPMLNEISAVCDTTALQERLYQANQQVTDMQQSIMGPLAQLQHVAEEVDAIEAEVKTMEKNVSKIRTILSTMDTGHISSEEHLRNRQVILDNIRSMKRTIAEIEHCRPDLGLPSGADQTLTVFQRAQELQQPVEDLEQITQEQSTLLQAELRQTMEQGHLSFSTTASAALPSPDPLSSGGAEEAQESPEDEDEDDKDSLDSSSSETLTGSVSEQDPEDVFRGDVFGSTSPTVVTASLAENSTPKGSHSVTKETGLLSTVPESVTKETVPLASGQTAVAEVMDLGEAVSSGDPGPVFKGSDTASEGPDSSESVIPEPAAHRAELSTTVPRPKPQQVPVPDAGSRAAQSVTTNSKSRAQVDTAVAPGSGRAGPTETRAETMQGRPQCETVSPVTTPSPCAKVLPHVDTRNQEPRQGDLKKQTDLSETPKGSVTVTHDIDLQATAGFQGGHVGVSGLPEEGATVKGDLSHLLSGPSERQGLESPVSMLEGTVTRRAPEEPGPEPVWSSMRCRLDTADQNEDMQLCAEALLHGLTSLTQLESNLSLDSPLHSPSQLQSLLSRHKKYLQEVNGQLALLRRVGQQLPEGALQGQAPLEQQVAVLQERGLEEGSRMHQILQDWTEWEEAKGHMSRLLDDLEDSMSSELPDQDPEEQLRAQKRLRERFEQSRAEFGLILDQGRALQRRGCNVTRPCWTAFLLRWRSVQRKLEQEELCTEQCRKHWDRFVRDSRALKEWMSGATSQLQTWGFLPDSQPQELSGTHVTQLMDFCMGFEVRASQKLSATAAGSELLQLTDGEALHLRGCLAELEQSWAELASRLPAVHSRLQQVLSARPRHELMSDLDVWLAEMEGRLEEDVGDTLQALGAAELAGKLERCQYRKAEISSRQPYLDFFNQSVEEDMPLDILAGYTERSTLAEQLGALNLRWLNVQRASNGQTRLVEAQLHVCAGREGRLQKLGGWVAAQRRKLGQCEKPDHWSQVEKALQQCQDIEEECKGKCSELQELKAIRLSDTEHPSDVAFCDQLDRTIQNYSVLTQQVEMLRPSLQQVWDQWRHFEKLLEEAALNTARTFYSVELGCRYPRLTLQDSRDCIRRLQMLQEKAEEAGKLWLLINSVLSSLRERVSPGAALLLNERVQREKTRWEASMKAMREELENAQTLQQLRQEYHRLVAAFSTHLQQLWEQIEDQSRPSFGQEDTVQHIQHAMDIISVLTAEVKAAQARVGEVLEAAQHLIGQLDTEGSSLIKSETRLLSRDLVHLGQEVCRRQKHLQEDLQLYQSISRNLETLEQNLKDVEISCLSSGLRMDTLKIGLLELSALTPDLGALNEVSLGLPVSEQQAGRLQALNQRWVQVFSQVTERYRTMQALELPSQSLQHKCEAWMSLLERMERNLATDIISERLSLQEQLALHQKLKAEVLMGQQLFHSVASELLLIQQGSQMEDSRNVLVSKLTQLQDRWRKVLPRAQKRGTLLERLTAQGRLLSIGQRKLWRLLRDVEPLLPPAGLAMCSVQQLQDTLKNFEKAEKVLHRHGELYHQVQQAGKELLAETSKQTRANIQEELQTLQEAWKHSLRLLGNRRTLAESVMENWRCCGARLDESRRKLEEIKTRLEQPLPEKLAELHAEEKLSKGDQDSLEHWSSGLRELGTMRADLSQYVLAGDTALLQGQLDQLHGLWEHLCLQVSLRKQEIADRLNAWNIFNDKNKELCDWLLHMDNKVSHGNEQLSIEEMVEKLKKDCMEEINLFSENKSHLKQLGEQLLSASDKAKEAEISGALGTVSERWQNLVNHIEARVRKLRDTLVTVQQLDKNMCNLCSWLCRIEAELAKPVLYSTYHSEEIQRRLAEQQELQWDIEQHTEGVTSVLNLCDVLLRDEDACEGNPENDSIQQTSRSLEQRWRDICTASMERRMWIEETWRLWCKFQDDFSHYEEWLRDAESTAADPNSSDVLYTVAKEELKRFEGFQREVNERLTQLEFINSQYRRLAHENRTDGGNKLKTMLRHGNQRWDALQKRVAAVLRRLRHFTAQREAFEGTRESLLVWLTEMDLQLTNVEHFTESDAHNKMKQLNGFKKQITLNTKKIDALIVFGEVLIQRSSPLDAALIEDELEELHSYCQEVFGRVARFYQRLTSPHPELKEEPELFGVETGDGDQSSQLPICLPGPSVRPSGRDSPVSVDSIPLEWDHTGDVGGSSSHEDDEDGNFFSSLSDVEVTESAQSFLKATSHLLGETSGPGLAASEAQSWHATQGPDRTQGPSDSGHPSPTHTSTPYTQGYARLMSECSGSIRSMKRVSLILDEEQEAEQGLTGLGTGDTQSGVIERWELLQAQAMNEEMRRSRVPQQTTSDLQDITLWLGQVTPELEQLLGSDSSISVKAMEDRVKQLKEMQRTFAHYKAMMLSLNLGGGDLQRGVESAEAQHLQDGLRRMNQGWADARSGLERWEASLRGTLMRCQEFHETMHALLLWLPHAESRRFAVNIHDQATPSAALQEHRASLQALQEELGSRQRQVGSLQDITSQLLPEDSGEDSGEAREKLHVIANKLRLLLRQVTQDLDTVQLRLESPAEAEERGPTTGTREQKRDQTPRASFFHRVLRAAFPLHLLFLLLLVLTCLVPLSEDDYSCTLSNNFARSFHPMLRYTNGPPPT